MNKPPLKQKGKRREININIEYLTGLLELKNRAESELKNIKHSGELMSKDALWQLIGYIEALTDSFLN